MFHRIALDQDAESYWTDYFGDYGAQLVRKFPLRIAFAVAGRSAEADDMSGDATARVLPLASARRGSNLHVEGTCVLQSKGASLQRAFAATFNARGDLVEIATHTF